MRLPGASRPRCARSMASSESGWSALLSRTIRPGVTPPRANKRRLFSRNGTPHVRSYLHGLRRHHREARHPPCSGHRERVWTVELAPLLCRRLRPSADDVPRVRDAIVNEVRFTTRKCWRRPSAQEVTNEERETQVLPLRRSGSAPEEAASDSYRRRAQLQGLYPGAGLRLVWRGVLQRACSR